MSIFVGSLGKYVGEARCQARHTIGGQPQFHSDIISDAKADAMYVLRQLIGIFTNDLDRFLAILLVDARGDVHRHIVRLQEEMQFFDLALLGQRLDYLFPVFSADALHFA